MPEFYQCNNNQTWAVYRVYKTLYKNIIIYVYEEPPTIGTNNFRWSICHDKLVKEVDCCGLADTLEEAMDKGLYRAEILSKVLEV